MLYLISSQPLVIVCIDMKNNAFKTLVFGCAGSGLLSKMLIISASVDVQYPAEGFDVMLEAEFIDSV